jgi:glycine cleavage system H protein
MADPKFLDSHEWHDLNDGVLTLGISRFAVDELTDVTFVELPDAGTEVKAGDTIGEIESVKATSDLYTGVSGKVIEVNEKVRDDPSLLNDDPQGDAWLIKIEPSDPAELDELMDQDTYDQKYPLT